jgi:TRAP-type uncharacterized transport system substrate-binding protein
MLYHRRVSQETRTLPRSRAARSLILTCALLGVLCAASADPAPTGFQIKRPVMAAACPHGCPWGELGAFVREAMAPLGYEVLLCSNCNRAEGPRIVAKGAHPPPLLPSDRALGDTAIDASVDFGVTEAGFLAAAYDGRAPYDRDGPYRNLRLIALIEDPTYLLIAVKASTGITDLDQIREKRMPVRIAAAGAASSAVLEFYGLNADALHGWGGALVPAMGDKALDFDVLISDLGSPANNPESSVWSAAAEREELRFLELPAALLSRLSQMPGEQLVTVQWGLLRGVDRPIRTVGRSGEAIFCRADTPEQAAYDLARAVLKWYIRPYSYDPHTVWKDLDVPLSPGAERYYREQNYLR